MIDKMGDPVDKLEFKRSRLEVCSVKVPLLERRKTSAKQSTMLTHRAEPPQ